ncbi:TonB-dependent siderophore receptor [uncultured Azohydromonas sp.]|jgi:TonB-dependent siderophore receptor|uniref:TonB-dependent receptor n=1 Tax=uncultured Azohydromonas sp. TaxID=487342 RepID=UPI002639E5B3|nr:TonB-dependent siderophore receptor [uncultured Azohydromonas sp.]
MTNKNDRRALLPLGALAAGFSIAGAAMAQPAEAPANGTEAVMPAVRAKAGAERDGKSTLRATTTTIGKGQQQLRDIPQSVTVVTERLIDDRNLDDFKDVLRTTSGVTFQAGETGEEDVRLRGFSLGLAGDIYVDGIRDPALYDRDTFNNDRIEVLKGSASMLFGRGSTGGVVNQVNKQPTLMTQHEVTATIGSGKERRLTGDFNVQTGEDAALRINAMVHDADNWGAQVEKRGIAPTFRWGIGTADEFSVGVYHLKYDNRPNYNHPWFLSEGTQGTIQPTLPAKNFYGLASDYHKGEVTYGTVSHTHRFSSDSQLKTTLRHGRYDRDLWASVIRFGTTNGVPTTAANLGPDTIVTRTPKGRLGTVDSTALQSDYSGRFEALGRRHDLLAGIDVSNEKWSFNDNFAGAASGLTTTVGTPNDGASFADTRPEAPRDRYKSRTIGLYLQDTVEIASGLKLVGGLRHDHFKASTAYSPDGTNALKGQTREISESMWSPRLGLLWQPDDISSYYVSWGTSFNTSGESNRRITDRLVETPPEKSRNIEIGAKFELFERRLSLGTALFRSEKYHERNTDPDLPYDVLSGKRHATGLEFNAAGRITPKWEAFVAWTWIPEAKIDNSIQALSPTGTGAQVQGDRPALTPKHSAALWTTYRVTPKLRLGAGLNYRGEQNPEGARHVTSAAFTTVDLMGEYTFSDMLSAQLNVNNATDKLYADTLYRGFYGPGAPRTVQLSVKARF